MSKFKNVTLTCKANVYFNGKVNSRAIIFEDGSKKTLGFMMKGEYTFNTESEELMEVLGGSMKVKLPNCTTWEEIGIGQSFIVSANSAFDCIIEEYADYCCSYK